MADQDRNITTNPKTALTPVQAVGKLFEKNQKRILSAVPRSIGSDPTRLLSIAYNTIVYDPKLVQCTHASLLGGVMEALKMGITIGGPMQESWLIPFNNSKKDGDRWIKVLEATMIVGYQGYRNIIDRGRAVLDLHPRAVHIRDAKPPHFDYQFGTNPQIIHRPQAGGPLTEDELYAVYAVARLRGGGLQMEVMLKDEIDKHRARSRAKDTGPWSNKQDYVPMALKTSLRKLSKYVPKSSEILARALDLDERADMGEPQNFELPEGAELFDPQPAIGPGTSDALDSLSDALRGKQPERATVDRQPGQEG